MVTTRQQQSLNDSLSPNDEPILGYRLIEPLGRGGFGEVWKCNAPGGLCKAMKIVRGGGLDQSICNAEQELRALNSIKSIRHPFLLSTERVERVNGDLFIVMELADRSLHDLLVEYQQKNQPGIPRWELICYLREVAEVLDLLNHEYGVKHLDIKPRNIFLVGKHVKVADFGLAATLSELAVSSSTRGSMGGLSPLYAAPETFNNQVTLYSDQYSLAVTYHELLTGEPVFKSSNYNQLAMMVCNKEPSLNLVPQTDRAVLARALAKDPNQRYPNCTSFIESFFESFSSGTGPDTLPKQSAGSSTSFELQLLADQSTTADKPEVAQTNGPGNNGSGTFRRKSRILPAVRPSTMQGDEGLSSYQLLDSLGRGPTGDLWKACGPGGQLYLLRFIPLSDGPLIPMVLKRLMSIQHPSLPRLKVLSDGPGRVALVSETGTSTLWERFRECQTSGLTGIPRTELLAYLANVAESLDELYHQYQIQHLMLSPRNLAFQSASPLLLEYGLADQLWMQQGMSLAQLNPRYSATEVFNGLVSDACDQYSLALIYQELLVGVHPFRHLNTRQSLLPRKGTMPDVALLPGPDRPVVLQALSDEPERRFRCCRDFVSALEEASAAVTHATVATSAQGFGERHSRFYPAAEAITPVRPPWRCELDPIVTTASRGHEVCTVGSLNFLSVPNGSLEHRAWARLPSGMARLKLDGFREHWQAEENQADGRRFVMQIQTPANLWDRCLGRSPGIQVEVRVGSVDLSTGLTPLRIVLRPTDSSASRTEKVISELCPTVLASIQTYLHSQADKLNQERFLYNQPVIIQPNGSAMTFEGQTRDIGREGLCAYVKQPILPGAVSVSIQTSKTTATVIPGRIIDCTPNGNHFEAEVLFG